MCLLRTMELVGRIYSELIGTKWRYLIRIMQILQSDLVLCNLGKQCWFYLHFSGTK